MKNRIYRISLVQDAGSSGASLLHRAWMLEAAITRFAASRREEIHFHRYDQLRTGTPVVLLECSENFLRRLYQVEGLAIAEHETAPTRRATHKPPRP